MSGYFSQLIGQTGIVLPQQNVRDRNVVSDIFSTESSGEEVPIQEEHVEVIVPQPEQPVSPAIPANREVREARSQLPSIAGETPTPPELLQVSSPEIPSVSQMVQPASPTIMPEAGELRAMANASAIAYAQNPQPTILEPIEVQSFSESIPISERSQPKETKSSTNNTEDTVADPPLKITEPEPIESVQVESKLEVTGSPKMPVVPLTRQAYLQAVREWVAGTPREIEQIQEISAQQPPESIEQNVKPAAAAPNRQPIPVPFALEPSRQSEVQPPQEQDFVLSIGSIHLTIEAPQPETLPPPVLLPQNSQNIKHDYAASRLSRYYLRLR
jgi:hypothetical protein